VNENVLELIDVSKIYGDFTAVEKVNLAIPKGSIYGYLPEEKGLYKKMKA
jgi:ABC-2 type transport system ATP-binding protein